jgi:voltage-gated potassium channel
VASDKQKTSGKGFVPPAHAYFVLLASLLLLWLMSPLLAMLEVHILGSAVFISLTLMAATYAMKDQGKSFVLIIVLGIVLALFVWADFAGGAGTLWIQIGGSLAALLFFGVVAYELLLDILAKEARVDANLISGAIAVYLLVAVCFSFVYQLIYTLDPHSFKGLMGGTQVHTEFTYFSFVTLTTLGYGDITPLTRVGGSFATLEAIIGQLYLTVLVARLVGMHISQGPKD